LKKLIIVLSLLLILSVAGCVAVFAFFGTDAPVKIDRESIFEKYAEEGKFSAEKELILPSKDSVSLTYSSTEAVKLFGYTDYYLDEIGNEYCFDEFGKFYAYRLKKYDSVKYEVMPSLPNDTAEKLATDFGKAYFGSEFDELSLGEVRRMNGYSVVTFTHNYGPDGIFAGPVCTVEVRTDGELISIDGASLCDLADFDEGLLDGVNTEDLTEYADKCVTEDHGIDEDFDVEVSRMAIVNIDGVYHVELTAEVPHFNGSDSNEYHTHGARYYYELKNKLFIIIAAVLAVLIVTVNVITAKHIEKYKQVESELDTFAFGYPETFKISAMCGDECEPQSIVLERGDDYFLRTLYLLDKIFTEAKDIREYNEKVESLDYSLSYIVELFPEKTLSMKIPLYDGVREIEAEKAMLILDGDDDGGKLVVYTEEKDYIFGIFDDTYDVGMLFYSLY